jgi:hypothetical protein
LLHKSLETAKTIHKILVDYLIIWKFAILLDLKITSNQSYLYCTISIFD